jgi:hypothetical protein
MSNGVKKNRAEEAVKVAAPGRTQQALTAGPHGSVVHADGSKQSEKNKHLPPLKGKSGVGGGVKNKY